MKIELEDLNDLPPGTIGVSRKGCAVSLVIVPPTEEEAKKIEADLNAGLAGGMLRFRLGAEGMEIN